MNNLDQEPGQDRRRFILRYGVLGFGLSMALVWGLAFAWWMSYPVLPTLAGALLVFPVCGYFWGSSMWRWKTRR